MKKAKIVKKNCVKHGLTDYVLRSEGRFRCKQCSVEAVTEKRRRNKKILVEYLGGHCIECGYFRCVGALEFHHRDPIEKDFGLSQSGVTKGLDKLKLEVKKCILLCNRCHMETHRGMLNLDKLIKKQKYHEAVFTFLKDIKNYKRYEQKEISLDKIRKRG